MTLAGIERAQVNQPESRGTQYVVHGHEQSIGLFFGQVGDSRCRRMPEQGKSNSHQAIHSPVSQIGPNAPIKTKAVLENAPDIITLGESPEE